MEEMYQEYKEIAEIYIVYIREAHAADGERPVEYAKELGITEHTTYGQRCETAERLIKDKELSIPCLIDDLDDSVNEAYSAYPDRIFVVRTDGRLAIAAARGPRGFAPALKDARAWLAEYQETGIEPELPPDASPRDRD